MTENEAHAQAFENGRKVGDAEGYARGKAEAFAESGDLISRKALLDVIAETAEGLADCDQQNAAWALRKYAIREIENAPTVDAVEVPDKKLLRAIKLLIKQYEHSKNSDYVHSPVAHALFHTWKQVDEGRIDNGQAER